MASILAQEHFWVDKSRFDTAERQYHECLSRELLIKRQHEREDSEEDDSGYVASKSLSLPLGTVESGNLDHQPNAAANKVNNNNNNNKYKKLKKPKDKDLGQRSDFEATATISLGGQAQSSIQHVDLPMVAGNGGLDAKVNSKKSKKKNKSSKEKKNVATSIDQDAKDKENIDQQASSTQAIADGEICFVEKQRRECTPPTSMRPPFGQQQRVNVRNKNASGGAVAVGNVAGIGVAKAKGAAPNSQCTLVSEIAKAREHIKNSLEKMDGIANLAASPASGDPVILERLQAVEKENADLRQLVEGMRRLCSESQQRITKLEQQLSGSAISGKSTAAAPAAPKKTEPEEDDGVDLFASDSDEESADAARIREERVAAYAAKKSKKPVLIAKSSVVLDVKPWDDETDLKALEGEIRKITSDGLLWGAGKLQPVAFGINKLTISCVVEDEKVSIDWLTEEIENLSDFVQSVDIAAFNKI